jgi:thaumarchaeosortase
LWSGLKAKRLSLTTSKTFLWNVVLPFSFILPVLTLYMFYPNSFQITFGAGRGPYLVFLWIACLEFAVYWKTLSSIEPPKLKVQRAITLASSLIIPIAYVITINYTSLKQNVVELGKLLGVPQGGIFGSDFVELHWPISFELMLFALCFSMSTFIFYKKEGLSKLGVALFYLWEVAVFNTVDTFFPVGKLLILQIFVPFTVNSSATVLRLIGYGARTMDFTNPDYGFGTMLTVSNGKSAFSAIVFWPSAGINSMIIYTLTILLFINSVSFSIKRKAIIFVVGAVGTFMANVLRIVTIARIGLENGALAAQHFHDYYGEFFFISWMIVYLTIVALGPRLAHGLVKRTRMLSLEPDNNECSLANITFD